MKDIRGKLVAYAELARATNVPTVATNVLAGAGLGLVSMPREEGAPAPVFPWADVVAAAVGVSLLYVGGMVMNGVVDLDVDREERPGRPVPSGRVGALEAWGLCLLSMVLGAAALLWADDRTWLLAALLVVCITSYNVWRPSGRRSVAVMGACRGLVYPIGALVAGAARNDLGLALGVGLIVGAYTVVLSVVARDEAAPGVHRKGIAWGLPWLALLAAGTAALGGVAASGRDDVALVVAAMAGMAWIGGAARAGATGDAKRCVLGALAGFGLVDALVLTAIGLDGAAVAAMGLFVVTVVGHRRVSGT